MKRWSLLSILCLVIIPLAPIAHGREPLLASTAFWVDEAGKATLREAMTARFQSYEGTVTKGYTPSTLWLRLRISGGHSLEPLAIIVRPAFLRRIELYDTSLARGDLAGVPLVSGRDAKLDDNNHVGLDNGFVIPASAEPRDLFLRITTTTTLTVEVNVKTLTDTERGSRTNAGALSVYCAFLLAFCLWGSVNWIIRREGIYGLFVLRLVFSILHIFVILGPLRYFLANDLEPDTRDLIYSLTMVLMPVTAVFDIRLLSDFGASSRIAKIATCVVALSLISPALLFLGHTQTALHFSSMIVSAIMLLIIVLAFSAQDRDKKPYGRLAILIIRGGFTIFAIVVAVTMLIFQNIISTGVSTLNIFFLHAVISTAILFSLLTIRARQRDLQAEEFRLQCELATQQLDQENRRRLEKERLLSMLTHELRNPLTVVRLRTNSETLDGQVVQRAATDIARVIERVEQSEKLGDEFVPLERTCVGLKKFLEDLVADQSIAERLDIDVAQEMTVTTDEQVLASVVRNLLDNAEKYSPRSSRIRISAVKSTVQGAAGATLCIVNDVGEAGIPDGDKVFSKYYRNKKAHRQPGSGLGLFLVAGWVKLLAGEVSWAHQADPDGRATVTFSLWVPG